MARVVATPLTNSEYQALFERVLLQTYAPAPIAFVRGSGCRLVDAEGRSYLDFAAGVAVCSTGHAHPRVAQAIADQAGQLIHTSNLYLIPNQLRLAEELVRLSSLSRAFFCNSGAEAVEAAMKLARLWGSRRGGRHEILTTLGSFHGRTLGALTATQQPKYQEGFQPLLPGVKAVPFGDAKAMEAAVTAKTCAVLVEPIQGEGGVNMPPAGYLKDLRRLCDERDLLLILDEVQTGIGRTGTWFAYQQEKILPDVVALAKGLASGVPIGCVLANERAGVFTPGTHGSTFGGNPLATAAALATLRVLQEDDVLANVSRQGSHLANHLALLEGQKKVQRVRGVGLLLGFDLASEESKSFARRCLENGLLVSSLHDRTIRLCPPLVVTAAECEEAIDVFVQLLP